MVAQQLLTTSFNTQLLLVAVIQPLVTVHRQQHQPRLLALPLAAHITFASPQSMLCQLVRTLQNHRVCFQRLVRAAVSVHVGDTGPGGGKIFLTPSSSGNSTGYWFEAAPSNWYSGTDKNNNWCHNTSYAIGSGAQGTAIGAGYANTLAIVAYCTSGAAIDARAYRGGSLSDWFLPSDDELQAMYVARTTLSMPATLNQCCPSSGIVTTQSYWSSTENNTRRMVW